MTKKRNKQLDKTVHQVEQRFNHLIQKKGHKHHDNAAAIVQEWLEVFAYEDGDDPIEVLWVPDFNQLTY